MHFQAVVEYGTFGQGLDAEATAPGKEALVLIGYDNNKTGKESKNWNALYLYFGYYLFIYHCHYYY